MTSLVLLGGGGLQGSALLDLDLVNQAYLTEGLYLPVFTSMPSLPVFTRSGAALAFDTRIDAGDYLNAASLISYTTGVPRINGQGMLIEKASTNYAYSGLTNISCINTSTYGTWNTSTVYDYEINTASTTTDWFQVNCLLTGGVTIGTTYSVSFMHQPRYPDLTDMSSYFTMSGATALLFANGSTQGVTVTSRSTIRLDSWYRTTITFTASASNGNNLTAVRIRTVGGVVYRPLLTAPQVETGYGTSWIKTSGAATTRNADVFRATLQSTPAGAVVSFNNSAPGVGCYYMAVQESGGSSNYAYVLVSGGIVYFIVVSGGVQVGSVNMGAPLLGINTVCWRLTGLVASASLNGAPPVSVAVASIPVTNQLGIGEVLGLPANDYVRRVRILRSAPTDAQMSTLSRAA